MADDSTHPRVTVIGVPFNSAGLTSGVARAPAALRHAGLLDAIGEHADVRDDGDVPFLDPTPERDERSGIIAPEALVSMVHNVRGAVGRALADDRLPLLLGGDCPVLLGGLAAARDVYGRVGVLFVDGHEDAYPPHQSLSGEAADMELGLALGREIAGLPAELVDLLPLLRAEDAVLLGPRDAATLRSEGVDSLAGVVELHDDTTLRSGDIQTITADAVARLRSRAGAWWLHVDLDVLSTEALAAVDYPQPGGLSWEQLGMLSDAALSTPDLAGWSVAIYNPDLDPGERGARRICEYVGAGIGKFADALTSRA